MNILDKLSLKKCTGCHACYSVCPKKAINMVTDDEGFLIPSIKHESCISCNMCINVCPVLNKEEIKSKNRAFGCYNRNPHRRLESASGGVFRLFADEIIENKGYVFGAGYDKDFCLKHMCVDNTYSLKCLLGTKYIQSEIGDSYKQTEKLLKKGKKVLFSGTPCQIYGLKSFLRKEYENLITIDLICHGVPSPKVWMEFLETKNKSHLISIISRDKTKGISNAPIVFKYDDGTELKEAYNDNVFLKGFIRDLYLRNCCYNCQFKGLSRISDLTIGDFWGIEEFDDTVKNDYGISVMITHNDKINQFIKDIEHKMYIKEYPLEATYTFNECLLKSVKKPIERKLFFKRYKKDGFEDTVNDLIKKIDIKKRQKEKMSFFYRVYRKLKRSIVK